MDNKEMKFKSPEYWTQLIQIMLYNKIQEYLDANGMTKKEFAEKLGVSKGYVSQILNGDFDHKLSKISELAIACELIPKVEFIPIASAQETLEESYFKPIEWNSYKSYSTELNMDSSQELQKIQDIPMIPFGQMNKINNKNRDLRTTWVSYDHANKDIA